MAALAVVLFEGPVKALRHWRRSDTYTPSGAAALAVVLIALTYKGAALAVVLFERPVKGWRHWRRFRHLHP